MLVLNPIQPAYPFTGRITTEITHAGVRRAAPTLAKRDLLDIARHEQIHADCVAATEGYQQRFVRATYKKLLDDATEGIARGDRAVAELAAVSEEALAEEFRSKSLALAEIQRKAVHAARPAVLRIHKATLAAVRAYVAKLEAPERALAAEFGVEFEASPALRLMQSIAMQIERSAPAAEPDEGEGLPRPSSLLHYIPSDLLSA